MVLVGAYSCVVGNALRLETNHAKRILALPRRFLTTECRLESATDAVAKCLAWLSSRVPCNVFRIGRQEVFNQQGANGRIDLMWDFLVF